MAGQVIATKLFAPKLRTQMVPRPRLQERLQQAARSRLTLVSAPAGFGKTTLLAEWMAATAHEGAATAWLSLDATDSDPPTFWTGVVSALQTTVPLAGLGALDPVDAGHLPAQRLLTALLNDLQTSIGEVWLVLDDFHLVDSRDVETSLALFLERLPTHVHVLISSRSDPALPLSRWRARGELTEVRASDLRFTLDEATTYLNGVAALELSTRAVAALEDRTEGWIAALQLAVLSMQGRADAEGFIARFAGDDRYIVDYLVEEVLAHQPAPIRTFLLESAVLDRLTGPLCDAVSGRTDGSAMLAELDRTNLFIVPLDDRRRWYRYHHLFADVLRARTLTEQPELVPQLHRRASDWYERHDMTQDAVRHAIAGADIDRATYLMESAMPAVRRRRQGTLLLGWLDALPDYAVRRSPVLSVFYGYTRLLSGDLGDVEPRLNDAEQALAAGPDPAGPAWADTEELRTVPATIAVYRASLAQARGDVPGTAHHARRALDLAGPTDHLARASGAGFLGLAAWAQGDVRTALKTFTLAVESMHAAGNLVDELSSTVVLADMWLVAGKPSTARRILLRALEASKTQGDTALLAAPELHVAVSELDREAGDLGAATAQLQLATGLGESASTENHYRWFVARAQIREAEGDLEGARDLLSQAQAQFRPGFVPEVRPIPAMQARVCVSQGNLADAEDWAVRVGVTVDDAVDYMREFEHLTLVRLHIAQHRTNPDATLLESAVRLLSRLREAAQTQGRAGSVIETRVLNALALEAQGRLVEAVDCLHKAWDDVPDPNGYTRLFLNEGPPMLRLLGEMSPTGPGSDHARRLLRIDQRSDTQSMAVNASPAEPSAETLSQRELQVLRMLESELNGPAIAEALFVSHNTVRTHTQHIFTKLAVTNRRAAVLRGHELGLL